ncbi:hypothetical protein Tco_0583022 [Tanacetum coccineum]
MIPKFQLYLSQDKPLWVHSKHLRYGVTEGGKNLTLNIDKRLLIIMFDHSVYNEPVKVTHSVSKSSILYEPSNSMNKFLGNDADEARRNKNVHNLVITGTYVDMKDFNNNINANVEWMGYKESVQEVNEVFLVEEDIDFEDFDSGTHSWNEGVRKKAIRQLGKINKAAAGKIWKENLPIVNLLRTWGKLPVFTNDGPSVDDGPSKASGSAKSNKGTKDSGSLKSKIGSKDSNGCPWVLQCSKLKREEIWQVNKFNDIRQVNKFNDIHNCLQSRIVKKCTASFCQKKRGNH